MKQETRVAVPVRCVADAFNRMRVDTPPDSNLPKYEHWVFDEFQIINPNDDPDGATAHARQLQLKVDGLVGQIKELESRLESSRAGALRYQIKFETVSELFDRCLNSMKQER